MAFGLHNLTNATQNASAPTGIQINQSASRISSLTTQNVAGSSQITGLLILGMIAAVAYWSDMSADTYATVTIPILFWLGTRGWLPFADGIMYGMALAVAAVFFFGLYKYMMR